MISQTLSHVFDVITWLTHRKNIHQNISYQHYILSHINRVHLNTQRLVWCTTLLLTTLDLNAHLNVSRIGKILGSQHIRYFIDHCPCCQKMNMLKIPISAHDSTTSTYTSMECLSIFFIGPFPDQGYILVIVDTSTRIVSYYWRYSFICCRVSPKTLRSFRSTSSTSIR